MILDLFYISTVFLPDATLYLYTTMEAFITPLHLFYSFSY